MDISRVFLACTALFLALALFQWFAKYLVKRMISGRPAGKDGVTLQKHFVKAAQLLEKKDDKEKAKGAIRELGMAANIDPKDPTIRMLKAVAHEAVGDINGCLKELDIAIENHRRLPYKDRAQAYVTRARVLMQWKRKFDHALVDLETSLTFDKHNAAAIAMLGRCYENKRQWATARDLYSQALKHKPRLRDAIEGLKRLEDKGDHDEMWGDAEEK